MKRLWLSLWMGIGLLILLGGFVYDTIFAGIPYQDPTPEMLARYTHHAHIAGVIYWVGVAVLLGGGLGSIIFQVAQRFRHC